MHWCHYIYVIHHVLTWALMPLLQWRIAVCDASRHNLCKLFLCFSAEASTAAADITKKDLLRASDVRLSALKQDLVTSCARPSSTGYTHDRVSEHLHFVDHFGANRLRYDKLRAITPFSLLYCLDYMQEFWCGLYVLKLLLVCQLCWS